MLAVVAVAAAIVFITLTDQRTDSARQQHEAAVTQQQVQRRLFRPPAQARDAWVYKAQFEASNSVLQGLDARLPPPGLYGEVGF